MLNKKITTVLFDLDGTLLPMDTAEFTGVYFKLLAKKAAPYGYAPKALTDAVWAGTRAMAANNGAVANDARFWQVFAQELGEDVLRLRPVFDQFYAEEFHGARAAVRDNPLARQAVEGLKAKGLLVALATNPLFPLTGQATRLSWLGLAPEDFALVTSYESCSYCKPNPAYFTQVLAQLGRRPEECLMVGNDLREDAEAARAAGLSVYLVTDCLEHAQGADLSGTAHGSFEAFMDYAGLKRC